LTTDSLVKGLESIKGFKNPSRGSDINYAADKHIGAVDIYLAVVEKGRWKTLEKGLQH
jgi:hypothetical protein